MLGVAFDADNCRMVTCQVCSLKKACLTCAIACVKFDVSCVSSFSVQNGPQGVHLPSSGVLVLGFLCFGLLGLNTSATELGFFFFIE